jgi:hypothetical protein
MTPKTHTVLTNLRSSAESIETRNDHSRWGSVYLDNAIPAGMSRRAFAGHLSALQTKGLYQPQGDDCFGYVCFQPEGNDG